LKSTTSSSVKSGCAPDNRIWHGRSARLKIPQSRMRCSVGLRRYLADFNSQIGQWLFCRRISFWQTALRTTESPDWPSRHIVGRETSGSFHQSPKTVDRRCCRPTAPRVGQDRRAIRSTGGSATAQRRHTPVIQVRFTIKRLRHGLIMQSLGRFGIKVNQIPDVRCSTRVC